MRSARSAGAPRVALVTGAGRGLGRSISEELSRRGLIVVAADVDADLLRWTRSGARAASYRPVLADVTSALSVDAMMTQIGEELGRLDVLVNNAGVLTVGRSEMLPDCVWEQILQVNLGGTIRLCRAAYPLLLLGKSSSIVNISSITGSMGFPGRLAYAASKAAIESLTRTLAVEWGPTGIRANAIAPGFCNTERAQSLYESGEASPDARSLMTPLRRHGEPAEIGRATAWLALDATFVSGQVIVVDGGFSVSAEAAVTPFA
jgi:NAD(P)-dependent dehydrogenase (short-subunit alcohol dehydrogenase family)